MRNQKSILKLPLHVHFRLVIHITFDRVAKERAANEIKTKADIKAGKTPEEMWYEDGHSGVLDEDK